MVNNLELKNTLASFLNNLEKDLLNLENQIKDTCFTISFSINELGNKLLQLKDLIRNNLESDENSAVVLLMNYSDRLNDSIYKLDSIIKLIDSESSYKLVSFKYSISFRYLIALKDNLIDLIPSKYQENLLEKIRNIKALSKDGINDKDIEVVGKILLDLEYKYGKSNIRLLDIKDSSMSIEIKNICDDRENRKLK